MEFPQSLLRNRETVCAHEVPNGLDSFLISALAQARGRVLVLVPDDVNLSRVHDQLNFVSPETACYVFPAWDCLPYDRVSPVPDVVEKRLTTLSYLAANNSGEKPEVVIATVSAVLQRVVPRNALRGRHLSLHIGARVEDDSILRFLNDNGYVRASTVLEAGEYARRGGIIDVFPGGQNKPLRIDFFGDEVDAIRRFDCETQRTEADVSSVVLGPISEVFLEDCSISRFRSRYREMFSVTGGDDNLYEAVSAGNRYNGIEHWLPFFHESLETLFDYLGDVSIVLSDNVEEACASRLDLISEYYTARLDALRESSVSLNQSVYRPVEPVQMYLSGEEFSALVDQMPAVKVSPRSIPEVSAQKASAQKGAVYQLGGKAGRNFADIRIQQDADVYAALIQYIRQQQASGKPVVLSAHSLGSLERFRKILSEHGFNTLVDIDSWSDLEAQSTDLVGMTVGVFDHGFACPELVVITEQDVLGEKMNRSRKSRVKPENIIRDASVLNAGDYVVHNDHGIARFESLQTIAAGGAPHDCLLLSYAGNDRLYIPVENIDVVSRYGGDDITVTLDRLGSVAWQARKARLKNRIRQIADQLVRVAAARELEPANPLIPQTGAFDEFCSRFPYAETEDQQRAIEAVISDLGSGKNTDRLVCGDVGFGKTEVALRAAFVAAMEGRQVALVVPTTLLARQHFENFKERFQGFPVVIRQLSRLTTNSETKLTKKGIADGTVDIIVGTHAVLAKDVSFRDLGLLVIDEEQHFGVAHKERLKQLRTDVHVLTLTATPIPRTLQMAMTGIRDMSLIATPPVDRLAVRTYVLPFDSVIIREAILRERHRGGQIFYVCPRVSDLSGVEETIRELVPDIRIVVVHGQMPTRSLEDSIVEFYEGQADLLISTNIIESGLDMPRVNTIIIHRADMFGLAQLYQLRGRVGRAKIRAYAYLTLPPNQKLTATAQKRLDVMQTLDHLGAGFTLASHDLDIRGAGNLLGDEQSGHIREVGFELYQQMLEEAVAEARGLEGSRQKDNDWTPQINAGLSVLIPDTYIADLPVRMNMYRRIASLNTRAEIDGMAAELVDRFGSLPEETENLLQTVSIKHLCRRANVEKIDAGPGGAVIAFHNDHFANPAGLVSYIQENRGTAKFRSDQKLVFLRSWDNTGNRLTGVTNILKSLARIAEGGIAG